MSLHILVADADEFARNEMCRALEMSGHRVATAGAGNEAIRLLKTHEFDVLVTEVLLPDGDGLDVIKFARGAHRPIRIVAISAGGRYLSRVDCLKLAKPLGAHAVALKPLTPDQLLSAIKAAVSADQRNATVSTIA